MNSRHLLILTVLVPVLAGAAGPAPENVDGDWFSTVQQRIAGEEYHLTWQDRTTLANLDQAWHAPNRAHNLRTYFTDEGIRVVSRTASDTGWEWSLSLIGYGRGGTVYPVNEPVLSPRENRIEYDRGDIVEWYVNDRNGLEQGFTLDDPPAGPTADEPAYLVLQLGGTLSPVISTDGQAIDFTAPGGARVLRYAKLKVTDASGLELPAWMEGFAENGVRGIRIVFDDSVAFYPVTVDPVTTSPTWTADGNQVSSSFGFSVSTAGDVNGDGYSDVIVGALGYDNGQTDEGMAFVYHGSASGLSAAADWTAEIDQAYAYFGWSVSTAGDVNGDGYADVIVGARGYDNVELTEGGAFVYHGSAAGLNSGYNWSAEGGQAGAQFGYSVSTAGDINSDGYSDVIVGAVYFDNGETDEGKAFVYHGSATGLSAAANWSDESDQAYSRFGFSVSTAGDVNADGYTDVIVGASRYANGQAMEGRAFVYHGSAAGLSVAFTWTAESDQLSAFFGASVSTAGDVNGDGYGDVIVGAYSYDNVETDEGRAYVYHGSAAGLSASESWTAEPDSTYAYFGESVMTAGDVNGDGYADVIVGARSWANGESNEGGAFVYLGSALGLGGTHIWAAEGNQETANYANEVSTAGDVNGDGYSDIIIGADGYDDDQINEGRAYVYYGSATGVADTPGWGMQSAQLDANLGWSVSGAGDINGDGYSDIIVGAPDFDRGEVNEGVVFMFLGSGSGLSTTEDWSAESDLALAHFGYSVSGAGDVNGDGYEDIVIGASGYNDIGRAFLFHGSSGGLSATPDWTADGGIASENFGGTVAAAGDLNGDGYGDVVVSAPAIFVQSYANVYHGSSSGLTTAAVWMIDGVATAFGAGDVNGDGLSDLIVGGGYYNNKDVRVFHGSPVGLSQSPAWNMDRSSDPDAFEFGENSTTAGDVNGDGFSDVLVVDMQYKAGPVMMNYGRIWVYHGSTSGLSATPALILDGDENQSRFGRGIGTAGDLNGDGFADIVIGTPDYGLAGRVQVHHGSASGLSPIPDWTVYGELLDRLGWSAKTAGDVNGDGYADLIVGAPGSILDAHGGRAAMYYGNGGPGIAMLPGQRKVNVSAKIGPLGMSDVPDGFNIRTTVWSPFGRTRVELQHEIKPLGATFDGTGTDDPQGWWPTLASGVTLVARIFDLVPGEQYHWRTRLHYHPASNPLQQWSRWFTMPRNGWNETDLLTHVESDLMVDMTDDPDPVLLGGEITYQILVYNQGPDGNRVYVRDTVPEGTVLSSVVPSQGTCSADGSEVNCNLGQVPLDGGAMVEIVVDTTTAGIKENTAWAAAFGQDTNGEDNIATASTDVRNPAIGNRVWEDTDGDGVQDAGEPGMVNVVVTLYDSIGIPVSTTYTDSSGNYSFPGLAYGMDCYLRFYPPEGFVPTIQDQGGDDHSDSDADRYTWRTPLFSLVNGYDTERWDAGMIPDCIVPDETVYIYDMTLTDDGNDYPVLNFQDPNQPSQVTGYNVYRSSDAGLPPGEWPLVASDVVDMDESEPNTQWVDSSGDISPTGVWYYDVAAFNHRCPAEGPR